MDTTGLRSKAWDEFAQPGAPGLDFVFTVCDNAADEVCPVWPGQPMTAHWGVEDPAAVEGTDEDKRRAFFRAYTHLQNRINIFMNLLSRQARSPLAAEAARRHRQDVTDRGTGRVSAPCEVVGKIQSRSGLGFFERWLTMWVGLCIVAGIALGQTSPGFFQAVGRMEVAQVNLPVGLLIWVMIIPMLMKIDFGALHEVKQHWRGVGVTLFVNWAVKPFSMALLGWIFIRHVFAPHLPAEQIDSYIAGLILLAAAPCTAMVFVWSNLSQGEPHFTLTQVALNDTIMVFAFAPIVGLLLGISAITVPWGTLFTSVVMYIVIPVVIAQALRKILLVRGEAVYRSALARIQPLSLTAPTRHPRPPLRFPGRGYPRPAARDRDAGGPDPDPGVLQFRIGVPAESPARRRPLRGGAVGPYRREQLLRACCSRRHQPVRLSVWRSATRRWSAY